MMRKFDVGDDVFYDGERATIIGLYVLNGKAKYLIAVDTDHAVFAAEDELLGLDLDNDVLRFIKETYSFLQHHEDVKGFSLSLGPTGVLSVDITTNVQGNFDFDLDKFDYAMATEYINRFLD